MTADHRLLLMGLCALLVVPVALQGQDPVPPIDQGVRIGITYTPGVRPGMLVLRTDAGEIVDSVEAILVRDLDYSDQFEMITLPGGERMLSTVRTAGDSGDGEGLRFVNYSLYSALGAYFAVEVEPVDSNRVIITLYDVYGQQVKKRISAVLGQVVNQAFRMAVHDIADQFVFGAAGEMGYSASSVLFVRNQRLLVIDADGGALRSAAPIEVETARLPLSRACRWYAAQQRLDPFDLALTGGEDYELLFTVAPGNQEKVARLARRIGTRMTRIGTIRPRAFGINVRPGDGRLRPLPVLSYDHFRRTGGTTHKTGIS